MPYEDRRLLCHCRRLLCHSERSEESWFALVNVLSVEC